MAKVQSIDTAQERYRAPALEKGLDILELLAEHADGLSKGEIARALDRSPIEIYRMLSTLLHRGYVSRSASGDCYWFSLRMFSLSHRHPSVSRLIEAALPRMRAVTRWIWQSFYLAMENNGEIPRILELGAARRVGDGAWQYRVRAGDGSFSAP